MSNIISLEEKRRQKSKDYQQQMLKEELQELRKEFESLEETLRQVMKAVKILSDQIPPNKS